MTDLSKKTAFVWDSGQWVELAVALAKRFGTVYYYCPWEDGYPASSQLMIGEGIPNVERVHSLWPLIDDIDLFVFTDVYQGALQDYLVSLGKRVWGSRSGEELELNRPASKRISRRFGIDVGDYEIVRGIEALHSFLKKNDDQWVKVSTTRGDMETFHSKTYDLVKDTRLPELEHRLGAKSAIMEFVCEAGINDAVEVGYDGYTIDGKFAKTALTGVESKDKGYVGCVLPYGQVPKQVREVNRKLSPALKGYGYKGFLSTEIRCTDDGAAYLIDPCCRCASPPSELYQLIIGNLADVMYEGAGGVLVEPDFSARWGAELILTSEWGMTNWQPVAFPGKYRDNVKLRNLCIIDGKYYCVPEKTGTCSAIGSVVATGKSATEAIEHCKEIAGEVEGQDITFAGDALAEAHESLIELVGDYADDRPKSKLETRAYDLLKTGRISPRQHAKMMQRERAEV